MTFTRGQTQVLYQFLPGAVFEHDDYGYCLVTDVELREILINRSALFDAIEDLLYQWKDATFRQAFPDPRDERGRRNYVVGSPSTVHFRPYPTLIECRRCERVFRLRDLRKRAGADPGHCPICGGVLGQIRYVQAHNCGRIEELYYQQCKQHGSSYITFLDTGRVRSARWRCGACGGAEIERLRMTPCSCVYSKSLGGDPKARSERSLRVLPLTDRALHLPYIVPFVNFSEQDELQLSGEPDVPALLLAKTWGILSEPVAQVIEQRRRRRQGSGAVVDLAADQMAQELSRIAPDHPVVRKWREQQQRAATPPGEAAIARVRALLGSGITFEEEGRARQYVEQGALMDTLRHIDISKANDWMLQRGDQEGAAQLQRAASVAGEKLGIADIRAIDDFPIAQCAVGFTRITRDPKHSVLSPFETSDSQGRRPLFVVAAQTEGIYLQLDPLQVAAWLVDNGLLADPAPHDRDSAWAWLYRFVPGLRYHRWQPDYATAPAVAVRTLLHTISHVLLRHVEWSGFSQHSIGEYLLPATLTCVLYTNRYAETKIGGLTTLFEQRLGIWLDDSWQSGRDCIYDPFCTDEGGSCVGCLHREHNCPRFNHELSRAVLYGGRAPLDEARLSLGIEVVGHGYWDR